MKKSTFCVIPEFPPIFSVFHRSHEAIGRSAERPVFPRNHRVPRGDGRDSAELRNVRQVRRTDLCYCSRLDEPAGASASCSLFLRFLQKQLCSGNDSLDSLDSIDSIDFIDSLWSLLRQLLAIGVPDFSLQPLPANSPAPIHLSPAGKGSDWAEGDDVTTPLSPAERDEEGIPAGDREDRMWQVGFPRGCDVVDVSLFGGMLRRVRNTIPAIGETGNRGERAVDCGGRTASPGLPRDDRFVPGFR